MLTRVQPRQRFWHQHQLKVVHSEIPGENSLLRILSEMVFDQVNVVIDYVATIEKPSTSYSRKDYIPLFSAQFTDGFCISYETSYRLFNNNYTWSKLGLFTYVIYLCVY